MEEPGSHSGSKVIEYEDAWSGRCVQPASAVLSMRWLSCESGLEMEP